MQTQNSRRSSLFLLELMIAILFFIIASSICVRLFVKSHALEQSSRDLDASVREAVSVAEILRSQDDPFSVLETVYPLGISEKDQFIIYYNKNWAPCTESDGSYHLELNTKMDTSFLTGTINVYQEESLLYSLSVEKYIPKEEGL